MEVIATSRTARTTAPPPGDPVVEDRFVVARCLAGDEKAAEALVRAYTPMIYGIGIRLTGREEDAEDLAQEIFLRVFRSLGDFRGDCSLRSWIAAIAVNLSRNRIGSLVRFRKVFVKNESNPEDEPGDDPLERIADPNEAGAEEKMLRQERNQLLADAIESLPVDFRETVILRDQQGLSYDEVSAATGVPVGTVRSRLARGRAILAKKLGGVLGERPKEGTS